jgi:dihydropteroate synthase
MAIVNRTPDSFFDAGATFGEAAAMDAIWWTSAGSRPGSAPR